MFIYDMDSLRILDANEPALRKYGYSLARMQEMTEPDLHAEVFAPAHSQKLARSRRGVDESGLIMHQRSDGHAFYARIRTESVNYDGRQAIVAVVEDISTQMESQQPLRDAFQELRYHTSNTPLGLIRWDRNFRIHSWSAKVEEILGLTFEDMGGEDFLALGMRVLNTSEMHKLRKEVEELSTPPSNSSEFELYICRPDGQRAYTRWYNSVLFDEAGHMISALSYIQDNTREVKTREQQQVDNRALTILSKINELTNRIDDELTLLQESCRTITLYGDYKIAWVGYAEHDAEKSVRPVAGNTQHEDYFQNIKVTWGAGKHGKGPTGTAIRTGRPAIIHFIEEDPTFDPWREQASHFDLRSSIALPLKFGDERPFGVLSIYSEKPEAFNQREIDLFTNLADDLAFGIHALRNEQRRRESDRALQEREELYRLLIEQASDAIFIMGTDERFIEVNPRAAEMMGYTREEMMGMHPKALYDPSSLKELPLQFDILRHGDAFHHERRFRRKDGSVFTGDISSKMISNGRFIGIVRDVTERRKAEDQLRKSEELFRQLFMNAPVGIALLDAQKKVNKINTSFTSIFGYSEDEISGQMIDEVIVPEELREEGRQITADTFAGRSSQLETYRIARDGHRVPVLIGSVPIIVNDRPIGIYGIYVDITDRVQAEEALNDEKEFVNAIINMLPGTFYMFNEDMQLTNWNPNLPGITGYNDEELPHIPPEDFFAEEYRPAVQAKVQEIMQKGHGSIEVEVLTKNGKRIPFYMSAVRFESGGVRYLLGTGVDITELKTYEQQIQSSLREKETLLAEIHHRVKNNLAVISGLIQLQLYNTNDENVQQTLFDSQSRIQSMAMIHEQLYQSEDLSHIDFKTYIRQLTKTISGGLNTSQKDINCTLNVDEETVGLNINQAVPFALILNELLTNAYKHAFKGRDRGTIEINLKEEEGLMTLLVHDDGVGLPADLDIETSSSLGMSLIETLIEQLEGTIKMQSDQGTDIYIEFPIE